MEALDLTGRIQVRPFRDSDEAFVFSSWLQSYWDGLVKYLTPVHQKTYFKGQHGLISRTFHRPGATVIVATPEGDDHTILGWLVAERTTDGDILHYVYVKEAFRELGIARTLLASLGRGMATLTYSHTTKRWQRIMQRYPEATFNPWLTAK